jgi:cytochrome c556
MLTASANRIVAINAAVKTRFAAKQPPTFAGHSEQLEKGTTDLLAALQAKDAAATQAAIKTIDGACGSCHKEFKQ